MARWYITYSCSPEVVLFRSHFNVAAFNRAVVEPARGERLLIGQTYDTETGHNARVPISIEHGTVVTDVFASSVHLSSHPFTVVVALRHGEGETTLSAAFTHSSLVAHVSNAYDLGDGINEFVALLQVLRLDEPSTLGTEQNYGILCGQRLSC